MIPSESKPEGGGSRLPISAAALAAMVVAALAVGAWLVPLGGQREGAAELLVFDPLGGARCEVAFGPLENFLARSLERPLQLVVADNLSAFRHRAASADIILCSDWVGLSLAGDAFAPLAAGRRHAPQNLRPRSVLVYRKEAGLLARPWIDAPERTILGDSLSLAAMGALGHNGKAAVNDQSWPVALRSCVCGPDPFDHGPALHAARLGCFDYAVVRQWAAERFLISGLLSPLEWEVAELTGPVPDVVVLASRRLSAGKRTRLRDALVGLGRSQDQPSVQAEAVRTGLATIGLAGFNMLLEADFDQLRRRFVRRWPQGEG